MSNCSPICSESTMQIINTYNIVKIDLHSARCEIFPSPTLGLSLVHESHARPSCYVLNVLQSSSLWISKTRILGVIKYSMQTLDVTIRSKTCTPDHNGEQPTWPNPRGVYMESDDYFHHNLITLSLFMPLKIMK
jgi:hypothetical protein